MNILLIGFGAMGKALHTCWRDLPHITLAVIDPLTKDGSVYKSLEELPNNFSPTVIVFAVKPQLMSEIVPLYKRFNTNKTIYVSIAAGMSVEKLETYLENEAVIIRAMPNLPATVGQGLTGLYSKQPLSTTIHDSVDHLFTSVGQVIWLESEEQLNMVTAISGSGPAYFYRLVESMIKGGQSLGLSNEAAQLLVEQTFIGAAELLKQSTHSATSLRHQVTSVGGTTAAALTIFDNQQQLDILVSNAIAAAYCKAKELSL